MTDQTDEWMNEPSKPRSERMFFLPSSIITIFGLRFLGRRMIYLRVFLYEFLSLSFSTLGEFGRVHCMFLELAMISYVDFDVVDFLFSAVFLISIHRLLIISSHHHITLHSVQWITNTCRICSVLLFPSNCRLVSVLFCSFKIVA